MFVLRERFMEQDRSNIYLSGIPVPMPVFTVSIETEKEEQMKKLEKVLSIIKQEDPTINYKYVIEMEES